VFGDLVRTHRRRRGLSQSDLVARAGVSERSVRAIERGRVRPRPETVRLLADAFALKGGERETFFAAAKAANGGPARPEGAPSGHDRPRPAQLPHGAVGFAGREALLEALDGLADAQPPTTVVISAIAGTAGVGKTALAIQWAHRAADRFPDGQLYVNLRGFDPSGAVMSPAEAVRGFLAAFAVPPDRVPPDLAAQVALYRSLLAGRRVLVILDNARDAQQVRPLLPGTPGCLAVVTSRNDMSGLVALDGARPFTLDVLTPDEAWRLLARRLGGARLAAEPAATGEIIGRCARLPLALAIVAARAADRPALTLSDLAGQLRAAGLEALQVGDAATDVRAVLGWSYRALGDEAGRLFRLLGLHPGPDISARAAASLAGIAPERVGVLLSELTRAHLLTEPSPDRYAFHDLLRVYAADLAHRMEPDGDRDAAGRRLLDHYIHSAFAGCFAINPHREPIQLDPPADGVVPESLATSDDAFDWFTAERAVLLAAVALGRRRAWYRGSWQLAWTLFSYLSRAGHWRDLVDNARLGLEAAAKARDLAAEALGHRLLGSALTKVERYDESEAHLTRSLHLYGVLGDVTGQAQALQDLGWLMDFVGRHREGIEYNLRAIELARAVGNDAIYANALNAAGWAYTKLEEYDRAIEYCREALALMEKVGEVEGQAATWDSLALCHHRLGQHAEAVRCYRTAIALFREVGNRYLEATTLGRLMDALADAGDLDAARHAGEEAVAILDQHGHSDADGARERLQRI